MTPCIIELDEFAATSAPVRKLVEMLLLIAIKGGASELHFGHRDEIQVPHLGEFIMENGMVVVADDPGVVVHQLSQRRHSVGEQPSDPACDREMADRVPRVGLIKIPVSHNINVKFCADGAKARC